MRYIKKILFYLFLLVIINLAVNYHFLYNIFYTDNEIVYDKEGINYTDNSYEITNINKNVKVIKIDFNQIPDNVNMYYTNHSFANYYHFNISYNKNSFSKDTLIVYAAVGKIKDLKITTNDTIEKITINPRFKYKLNIMETLIIYVLVLFLIFIYKNNTKTNFKNVKHLSIVIMTLLILMILSFLYYRRYNLNEVNDLYNKEYTDAIINGTLVLDHQVEDGLLKADNPYDTSNRGYDFLWDASYYNGKYYCYFGILPNIFMFVPYKLITGYYLPTSIACFIYTSLSIISTFFLFKSIISKYFKDITIGKFILTFLYIILGSKLLWCMYRPKFYELVAIAAYFHITLGLFLTLFSNNQKRTFLGYLSLALAVLCRPTALLASFLIVPKLVTKIKNKDFKKRDFITLIIPYLVVGVSCMYMNYIRFGSILEFGVSYQLTTNNLYNNNFSILKSICGGFYYLFLPFNIRIMPFKIIDITNSFPIIADYYVESIGGGFLATSVIGLVLFISPSVIKRIKEKELKTYLIMAIILACCLILISAGIGALIGRYMLDFNYLLYFATVILSLYMIKLDKSIFLEKIYTIGIILSIIINYCLIFINKF